MMNFMACDNVCFLTRAVFCFKLLLDTMFWMVYPPIGSHYVYFHVF